MSDTYMTAVQALNTAITDSEAIIATATSRRTALCAALDLLVGDPVPVVAFQPRTLAEPVADYVPSDRTTIVRRPRVAWQRGMAAELLAESEAS